jgi:hypothetical protein
MTSLRANLHRPRRPGVASLYTKEYFQLIHDHLSEGSFTTYWLPIMDLGSRRHQGHHPGIL